NTVTSWEAAAAMDSSRLKPFNSSSGKQLQLLLPTAQIMQPDANPQQTHRFVAAGKSAGQQLPIAFQLQTGPGLLEGGLGKVVELDLDEGLVRPVAGVQALQTAVHLFEQRRQLFQAALQIRQILIVGMLDAQ